jgi:asparagine synthase (glutamine-hydrolysing)
MCGIFGIITLNNSTPGDIELRECADLISHRGPDFTGVYSAPGIGLAHTRLSIMDISERSNQPFWDDSGRYCIIYNGEVYNFEEIRARLQSRGVTFRTTGDTEVLLQAMIHEGESAINDFMGMFAFCFYDRERNASILCRDRFGIKPFYYSIKSDRVVFSSEQAPVLKSIGTEPDQSTIFSYLLGSGGPHNEHTFFKDLKILMPGHVLKIENNSVSAPSPFFKLSSFWEPEYSAELNSLPDIKIVDRLEELLIASVKKHMISDTPVAALCSGGVDSSLILALAAKENSNLSIFHSDVVGRNSERFAAEALAKHLNLDLQCVEVYDQDFIDSIPKVTRHYGQPFAYHPNSVPFLKVTELVNRNKIKVILTGEAADEEFLGYSYLPTQNIIESLQKGIDKLLSPIRKRPLLSKILFSQTRKDILLHQSFFERFDRHDEEKNLLQELTQANGGSFDSKSFKTFSLLTFHLRSLLHRNDALGMASSIEARFPFLDHDVVKFACNLPYRHKIKFSMDAARESKHPFLMTKWAMREVARRHVPKELSYRPKKGFPTDAFERMKINELLFKNSFVSELFEIPFERLKYMFDFEDKDFYLRLMLLEVWGKTFFYHQSESDIRSDLVKNIAIDGI